MRFQVFAQRCVLVTLVGVTGCSRPTPPDEIPFDPFLARSAPEVADVSTQILTTPDSEGNARLRVRFKQITDRKNFVIQGGDRPTLLRDDGSGADERAADGVYSAFVNFDADAYSAEIKRRADRKVEEVPVFKNRVLIGKKGVKPTPVLHFNPGDIVSIPPFDPDPDAVDPARELLITAVSVVEDPARTYNPCNNTGTQMGPWTFGKLMTEMANEPATGINPSDFTLHWLQQWSTDLVINSFTVGQRVLNLNEQIINPWPKLADGRLDLAKAPFRLLAIVNRIDLRGNTVYGSGDAGEARLVFGLLRCSPPPGQIEVKQFTVIFEYGIKKASCMAVRDWAQQWHALGTMVLGSAVYNTGLQAITDQFTLRNADPAKPPNQSALNQLRTNEFAIARFPSDTNWELREFKICGEASTCSLGRLEEVTIAQTPDHSFQNMLNLRLLLRDFINGNEVSIVAGTHVVPLQLPPSTPFRAGAIQPVAGFPWDPGGVANPEARHVFSLATCNGCHTRETGTLFLHIAPRSAGSPSALSDFLTGLDQPVNDPVTNTPRTFHDLLDRQMKLDGTANMACPSFPIDELFLPFVPLGFVH